MPDTNINDVSPISGYNFEKKTGERTSDGYGGQQTRLPQGHIARRDAANSVRSTKG